MALNLSENKVHNETLQNICWTLCILCLLVPLSGLDREAIYSAFEEEKRLV